ncbi:hypothetical protein BKA69DRAFT_109016 [Paraphysoderma sedebokerense]|nr:hypothetical protein BKA69DRAFT_109016 [Paraphysoderma sedebokerense]
MHSSHDNIISKLLSCKQHLNQYKNQNKMQTSTLASALLVLICVASTQAHFTLVGSREQAKWQDNQRFWPIGGGATLRPVLNCLSLPASSPRSAAPSASLSLPFEIGNGASHVGNCKASLYDRKTGKLVNDLGSINNCVSNGQVYNAQLPANPGCSECVIKVEVHAVHIPTAPEDYDSCIDINISGGGSSGSSDAPAQQPSSATPAAPAPNQQQQQQQSPTPSANNGGNQNNGRSGRRRNWRNCRGNNSCRN